MRLSMEEVQKQHEDTKKLYEQGLTVAPVDVKRVLDLYDTTEALQQENEQLRELAKAKAEGRLKILPAKPGDIIYRPEALQFCWVITKVEIYEDEIVFIDDSDNIFRPDDIGKTVFLTREAAEKALEVRE